jgi:hypothetical protein
MTVAISGSGSLSGVPALSGTPIFHAYRTAVQAVPNSTATKLQLDIIGYDSAGAFSTVLNRYVPNVPGYYFFAGLTGLASGGNAPSVGGVHVCYIYKNGVLVRRGSTAQCNNVEGGLSEVTGTLLMNGTTDYVELFVFQNSSVSLNTASITAGAENRFEGFLVRAS